MTTLALAEQISRTVAETADTVEEVERSHDRVVYRVTVGRQVFIVTCEESAPDKRAPTV
ncbi:MAG: hypothetical protein LC130_12730 [Bryobacterales bacterium]|nr:hypothetical protein [Bryobacterales bacterium]